MHQILKDLFECLVVQFPSAHLIFTFLHFHFHQMASTLCQGLMTKPSNCGMMKQGRYCNHLLWDMRVLSCLLHFHQMASKLYQGPMTRPSGCGLPKQERCCNHLLRDMGIG